MTNPSPPTRVINLARNPASAVDALDTAARIERAAGSGSQSSHDFTFQRVDSERIERGDWSGCQFPVPLPWPRRTEHLPR